MKKTPQLKILVCEADVRVLSRLESWINAIGEDTIISTDGIEAFETYKKLLPDIVVISQNIKSIGAIELIKKIKEISSTQAIVFIVSEDTSSLKIAIDLQVDKYLNSPVEAKPLFYAINSLAEEKLWQAEFRSQKRLLEDYKDAIDLSFSVSRHDKEGSIIYVNELFCLTTKLEHADAMKGIINPLQNSNENMNIVWDALRRNFIYKNRQVFKLEDKKERIIDITAVALKDDEGLVYEYLVFSDDVTVIIHSQRKIKNQELDKRLAKLNHAKELNKIKDSFLTIFTHELKTPLNSIINFSQYVQKHLNKENFAKKDKLLGHVDEIHASGLFMLEMISNLMEAMKLRDSKIDLNISHIDLKETIESLLQYSSIASYSKNIMLLCDANITIESDQNRLTQILKNVISNAIKYANIHIVVNVLVRDEKFSISVEDDGKGFSNKNHVFDIFEQSDFDSMTREATGTGVGLYIVKQLCDRMQYTIQIATSSELGGASVTIQGQRNITR